MSLHSERYLEMVERMGGVNPEALESFFYFNNPFALKHWTQNVVELLYIAGAVAAFMHAFRQLRTFGNARYLAFLLSMIVYCFVIEVPIYFPQLLGLPPDIIFIHNEFTFGFVYNMTPLYIACLYPALLYSVYVYVDRLGVFERYPVLIGAICVGFVHSCLYEIFDHYGPQYNWWIWDYDNPTNALLVDGVPLLSIANFSLIPPIAMTLLARWLLLRNKGGAQPSLLALAPKILLVGVLTPAVMFIIAPTTVVAFFTDNAGLITIVAWLTLAAAATVTVVAFIGSRAAGHYSVDASIPAWRSYPFSYFSVYLVVFAALWVYALQDYFAAVDGITHFNTYTGSLSYVIACYAFSLFFMFQMRAPSSASSNTKLATSNWETP